VNHAFPSGVAAADSGLSAPAQSTIAVQVFIYLQLLDLLTTLVGLQIGLGEASPFIRWLMSFGPVEGLAMSKLIAVLLGGYCVWRQRLRVIHIINYWFAALIVWNLSLVLGWLGRATQA
jgi:hypothetical protein